MAERVSRYRDKVPLFEAFGVDAEIRSTLSRRVDLPSGGYLIFDYAEAFTVIDVNTGRFVGSRSKSSGARLEDTVTKNNLEAVKEVVRQLRLRDIGGIIVIDFIDMANPKNREAVEQALQQELERDRTKTYVVEISPLGLVEMTRQNVTDGPREILTRKCPTCAGEGVVVSEATAVVDAERKLRALAASKPRTKAFKVELNSHVAELLIGPGAQRLQQIEAATRRRFFVVGGDGASSEHFEVLEEGTVEKLQPADAPVTEGQTIDVKLVEVGRHDAAAGVGHLDGMAVAVGGAARLVGKKVSAHVERVLDGVAYATLAGVAAEPAVAEPITAEAQAEKPTRASRAKKPEKQVEAAEQANAVTSPDAVEEPEEPEEAPPPATEPGAPAKKKSRRGSRGGRGRKKKPALAGSDVVEATDAVASADTVEEAAEPVEAPQPATEPTATAKKRTRRGSRGGRGRKKPSAIAAAPEPNGASEAPPAEAPAPTIHVPEPELTTHAEATNGDQPAPRKKTRRGSRGGRNRRKRAASPAGDGSSDASSSS
jgi:ribonuclease G